MFFRLFWGGLLSKKKGFVIYIILIIAVACLDPENLVGKFSDFIKSKENGGPLVKLIVIILVF